MTYSIVARDPSNGDLGLAVQSKFLAVGSLTLWATAGIGAVAVPPSGAGHSPQNFASAALVDPQVPQVRASPAAHSLQNLRPASLLVPQLVQTICPPNLVVETEG